MNLNGGIIGLDMGLGKTVIVISTICAKAYDRVLIVLPLALIEQWRQSLLKFTNMKPSDIVVYQGPERKLIAPDRLSDCRITLTTYDMVRSDPELSEYQYDCVVLDEAHNIRNPKTVGYKKCTDLASLIPEKWLLTGTTIHNSIKDFDNLAKFLCCSEEMKDEFQPLKRMEFKQKYYYRLVKSQCNLGLPEKVITDHHLRFENELHHLEYDAMYMEARAVCDSFREISSRVHISEVVVKILRLRQCCNHIDAPLNTEDYSDPDNRHFGMDSAKFLKIKEIITNAPKDDKIVIFSQWTHTLNILGDYIDTFITTESSGSPGPSGPTRSTPNYLVYGGDQSISERNRIIERFKTSDTRILLLSLSAGGVGLDMSFANHAIIVDSWWNQALESQAIDRIYRIGQKKKVFIHRLYMVETIEEWMLQIKAEKTAVEMTFHNDGDVHAIDAVKLMDLLYKYIY